MSISSMPTFVMCLTAFTSACMYAIMFPTLSPFLESIQPSSTPSSTVSLRLGLCVSSYSMAKVLCAPYVGKLSASRGTFAPLLYLLIPYFLGNTLYFLSTSLSWWCVLVARFLVGVSATSSTVGRAWVPKQSKEKEEQARLVGYVNAASTLGFVAGPAMSIVSVAVGTYLDGDTGALQYSVSALVADVLGVITLLIIFKTGRDRIDGSDNESEFDGLNSSVDTPRNSDRISVQSVAGSEMGGHIRGVSLSDSPPQSGDQSLHHNNYDRLQDHETGKGASGEDSSGENNGLIFFYSFIQLSIVTPFATFESITSLFALLNFSFTTSQVGFLFLSGSLVTIPFLLTQGTWSRAFRTCRVLIAGQLVCALSLAGMCLSQEGGWITFSIFYNTFMVGYAVAQSMVFVDFFQVFGGNVKLGLYLGYLSSVGSLGRAFAPIVATYLYDVDTTGVILFGLNAGLLLLGTLCSLCMSEKEQ